MITSSGLASWTRAGRTGPGQYNEDMLYDDGRITCDDSDLIIQGYYLWGAKKIPYTAIRSLQRRELTGRGLLSGRWRIWGSGDFVHWWNFDPTRPRKKIAIEINAGRRVIPTITPDDPDAVELILTEHLNDSLPR